MYAKLFSRIAQSSLMEEKVNTRYVFMMMLALADRHGDVIGTDVAIARMMNITKAEFEISLAPLLSPDPDSNSQAEEGRRLIPSDNGRGYKVVNYGCYRDMKSDEEKRDYMRNYMRQRRANKETVNPVKICKTLLSDVTHTEVDTDTEVDTPLPPKGGLVGDLPKKPKRHKRLTSTEKRTTKIPANTPAMISIGAWFGRQESTLWTITEAESLARCNPSEKEIAGMEGYYLADHGDKDYRRTSVITLLNNWQSELDRAREWWKKST